MASMVYPSIPDGTTTSHDGNGGNMESNRNKIKDSTPTANNTTGTEKQQQQRDEWVFSMQLPPHCVVVTDGDGGPSLGAAAAAATTRKKTKQQMIQMRHSQPRQPPLHYTSSSSQFSPATAAAASPMMMQGGGDGSSGKDDEEQVLATAAAQERTSLLASSACSSPSTISTTTTTKPVPIPAAAATASTAAATTLGATTGWTLYSPYWSIQSDILLQVTFRPAWQIMPEFTNVCQSCGKCNRTSNGTSSTAVTAAAVAVASLLCCGCSANDADAKIDFMTHTWTIHDIVSVQEMNDYHGIAGIGSCRAVKVELKPMSMIDDDDSFSVPPRLQSAWERHVQQLVTAQEKQSTSTTTATRTTRATTRSTSGVSSTSGISSVDESAPFPHDDIKPSNMDTTTIMSKDGDAAKTNPSGNITTNSHKGPTVIFCLPHHQVDAPLLWKVHFPPLARTAIAMETITVMEGSLLTSSTLVQQQPQQTPSRSSNAPPSRQTSNDAAAPAYPPVAPPIIPTVVPKKTIRPTHIYITGYQSWSFAGSVARGYKQPTSALPKIFSRAFNFGGTPPPLSSSIIMPTTTTTHPVAAAALVDEDIEGNIINEKDDDDEEALPLAPVSAYYQRRETKDAAFYQSDFFTCITSDGGQLVYNDDDETSYVCGAAATAATTAPTHLDERGGPALLLGWLAQHEQFGVITADKSLQQFAMHASIHGQIILPTASTAIGKTGVGLTTDWAYVQLISPHSYDEEPMVHYLHSVAAYNQARPLQNGPLLTGWCSWYHYYENISESNLRENFAKLAAMRTKVPTNVAVVDDGYMTAWGDWDSLKPHRFSNTLEIVSRDIQAQGMRPGLWLAPFAADKHSKLVQEHPDWIIRNDRGIPANSSYCGKFFYGLDATNPSVRQYVHGCIRRAVHDWKFNVLKIDFLYAACLHGNGKYDLSMSRAQAMHLALQTIRDAAGPDVFLIGCGCPIAAGIGYVDGMRISADTGPTWKPAPPLPSWDNSTLPCLRSMVRNSLSRAPLGHRWWHNDPDCLLLGESTRLSDEEVASAASIVAMTCGMMLLSDDLTRVSLARMKILTKIFPMVGATAVVLDLHSTATEGLPSLLRLWCSDKYNLIDAFRESFASEGGVSSHSRDRDHNAEATFFARAASFQFDVDEITSPNERKRSCIHVTRGLGTWTVVSISNWSDKPEVVHVPELALLPPPSCGFDGGESDSFLDTAGSLQDRGCNGYHVFAFWSSKYSWLPDQTRHGSDINGNDNGDYTLSRRLAPHETEIFHIKPVTPDRPQYIGSDIHFSCGQEVRSFRATAHSMQICLKTEFKRVGHIFVFVPRIHTDSNSVQVTVNGKPGRYVAVGNTPSFQGEGGQSPRLVGRVLCILVVVHADGSPTDGQINVDF